MVIVTTLFTITRQTAGGDPYEPAPLVIIAAGVPGHLSAPSGIDVHIGGEKELVTAVAYLPAGTDVLPGDLVIDVNDGGTYYAVWSRTRIGLGLDHDVVGVRAHRGGADG